MINLKHSKVECPEYFGVRINRIFYQYLTSLTAAFYLGFL